MPKKRIRSLPRPSYDRHSPFAVGHNTMRRELLDGCGA